MIKLFLLISLVLLYCFLGVTSNGKKLYYWLSVVMLLVREIDVPYLGDVTPSAVMITMLFVSTFVVKGCFFKSWLPYLLCLLLSTIIAYVNSPYFTRAFEWVYNLFIVMAFATLPTKLFTSEKDVVILSRVIIIVSFIFSLATIAAYWGYADGTVIIASDDMDDMFHGSRIYGLTGSNLINCVCVISFVLFFIANFKHKLIELVILIVIVYGALITLKRMTFISMGLSLMFYIIMQMNNKKSFKALIVTVVVITVISIFWEPIMHRFSIAGFGANEIEDHSAESRMFRYGFALEAFKESPIIGTGAGNVTYVHNGLLEILANCGLLGIIFIFLRYLPSYKHIKKLNPWSIAIAIYLATCFFLESSINHAQIIAFLGVFLGGYYSSIAFEKEKE